MTKKIVQKSVKNKFFPFNFVALILTLFFFIISSCSKDNKSNIIEEPFNSDPDISGFSVSLRSSYECPDCVVPDLSDPNLSHAQAIQEAIELAWVEEHKTVCLDGAQTYEIDAAIFANPDIDGFRDAVSICGNGATLQMSNSNNTVNNFHMLLYGETDGWRFIDNVVFNGNGMIPTIEDSFYPLFLNETSNLDITNCVFENIAHTALLIRNSSNIRVYSTNFQDIRPCDDLVAGQCTDPEDQEEVMLCPPDQEFQACLHWDAIRIVADGSEAETSNINVRSCEFRNIGNYTFGSTNKIDADAIHINTLNGGTISDIACVGNLFDNIGNRSLKIMSGSSIQVSANEVSNCFDFVGLPMTEDLNDIYIDNNQVSDAAIFLETSNLTVHNLFIKKNTFDTNSGSRFVYMGPGSRINSSTIHGNVIQGLGAVIWAGQEGGSDNVDFKYNTIEYGPPSDGELAYPMLLHYPSNWLISRNTFTFNDPGPGCFFLSIRNGPNVPGINKMTGNVFNSYQECGFSPPWNYMIQQIPFVDGSNELELD